jgi:hypothetical protein
MAKKIILFCILFVSLTGCRSIKTTVFSGDAWTTIPDKEIVRNLSSGFAFDLQGLQEYYWELPDSANLITDSRQLLQNKDITKYAKFLFDDLKITKNDTLLFFIPGELLVYRPKHFLASQADYCFFTPDSVKDEYTRIINDPTGKIQNNDIFRNLIFNKKHKRIICTDTFRDGQNNWLSMAYIREAKNRYNSHISPRIWTSMIIDWSKPQNLLIAADRINRFDKITQKNRLNISLKDKPAFSLFKDFFKTGRYYNYYSAYRGEKLSENYFEPQAKSIFLQALATYFSFTNDSLFAETGYLTENNGFYIFEPCLSNLIRKATTDSVSLIRPNAEDKYIKNVNLFIFNDLDIRKNTTKIDIPKNIQAVCKIVCAYEKDEFEQLTKLGKIPLPVAVQHVETESFIRLNIEAENYILLFLDKYGNVLKSIEHSS